MTYLLLKWTFSKSKFIAVSHSILLHDSSCLTITLTFVGIAKISTTTAFVIVFPCVVLPSSTATSETVSAENGKVYHKMICYTTCGLHN
jgi:hypothetical protein